MRGGCSVCLSCERRQPQSGQWDEYEAGAERNHKPRASGIERQWSRNISTGAVVRPALPDNAAMPEFAVSAAEPAVRDPNAQIRAGAQKHAPVFEQLTGPTERFLQQYLDGDEAAAVHATTSGQQLRTVWTTVDASVPTLLQKLNENAWASPAAVVAGLLLLERLAEVAVITGPNCKFLFLVCTRLACKVLEHNSCNNRKFAECFGFPRDTLNGAEAAVLEALGFDVTVLRSQFEPFVIRLFGRDPIAPDVAATLSVPPSAAEPVPLGE